MNHSRLAAICIGIAALIVSITPGSALARQGATVSRKAAAPVFSFPTNGTSYPSNGPYVFQVQPLNGAKGYLWSFVQNGMVVYQNLAWDGHLSPADYTISASSKAHGLIHSGDLHVWVRALMKNGQWSATGAVMVRIQGKGGSKPKPTVAPQPTPTADPKVLYQADWTSGLNGWTGSASWKTIGGMLLGDGSNSAEILAPYQPTTPNYAVEAQIKLPANWWGCGKLSWGIVVRHTNDGEYTVGQFSECGIGTYIWANGNEIASSTVGNPGEDGGWHKWRVEVQNNVIRLLVDGSEIVSATDNHNLSPGQVGLWSNSPQVSVRSFKVIAL